ncbi:ATP-dependent RNA helicase DBP10 [Eremomyces bilateralis CBS 781.70]|uniref:RNA helicase n=1 Tax=Eremomyces bilateralis CBS 781.70 TaxID=1392243 RepID=A0A6G1GFZ6_9PEZI|nr:ATP-dependent RNA helicase DBP10 [Eremomyces bilateralis CBS 781.70]KAF1816780.1 ATP-dependent RNA helicase DBP10 [Eremomyces bilateralis CBS 781.70]
MAPRAPSPALSVNEFDITDSLFGSGKQQFESDGDARRLKSDNPNYQELGVILDEDGSDDEKFIAAQQAASNRKASNLKGRTVKKGGGFQAMGLNQLLMKAIARKGFSVPTPIQRKTIPLLLEGKDVVGMARTGSGKTAAFVLPMIEKLKTHSAKVGSRAMILSPSRELALQTLKVVKELGKGTDLRTVLLVGGDSLDEQFSAMTTNPDIIIATPGRLMHLKVEMRLDLSSVRYVVFDEADRLFEMGFASQLHEILASLPPARQTLLFSATLPKSLVEFARAGLQEPTLVRLDAESKISPDLQSAFFTVKTAEREGALLYILEDIIKMPQGPTPQAMKLKEPKSESSGKKRKRGIDAPSASESPTEHSTIVFVATKHCVEYLAALLKTYGYAVSHAYGALDQTARKVQVQNFRMGLSQIMVVTDVAARGIDIPILANVINYNMPSQPKIFVHRVGRTARAGKKGWSYSLARDADLPYLLDLQLFLSRRLIEGRENDGDVNFASDVAVGSLPKERLGTHCEWVGRLLDEDFDVQALKSTSMKGERQYERTRNGASSQSAKRSSILMKSGHISTLNPLFSDENHVEALKREKMMALVSGFRPQETVFEFGGKKGEVSEVAEIAKRRRQSIQARKQKQEVITEAEVSIDEDSPESPSMTISRLEEAIEPVEPEVDIMSDDDMEVSISNSQNPKTGGGEESWRDDENFLTYQPKSLNLAEDQGYGVQSGTQSSRHPVTFLEQARGATLDLVNDESKGFAEASKVRLVKWDKKAKKYVKRSVDDDGSGDKKMIRGESGLKLAASFRSGRFDEWKKSNRIGRLPRIGEAEVTSKARNGPHGDKRFKHNSEKAPKEADRFRDDYHTQKQKVVEAKEKRIGKFKDGVGKSEVRNVDAIRKQRKVKERRKEKNARPAKKRRT